MSTTFFTLLIWIEIETRSVELVPYLVFQFNPSSVQIIVISEIINKTRHYLELQIKIKEK
jgi:hypothetical protein